MNWAAIKNNQVIKIKDIPVFSRVDLLKDSILKTHHRVIGFFGLGKLDDVTLYVMMADDLKSEVLVSSCVLRKGDTYSCISKDIASFNIFEREFYEDFGIEPEGHNWLNPVRKKIDGYNFLKMEGEEVHQVAVGPVHAGVIEPGHFRFMCNGEKVYWLDIQLGYQHRGVEHLFEKNKDSFNTRLAESIAGDTVIGHTVAYADAIESLKGCRVTDRAEIIRAIAVEMERVAVHIGDLGAISGDIAYLMGNSIFGATRTLVINSMLSICGSRFGRGLICSGGVNFDISDDLSMRLDETMDKVYEDVENMCKIMFSAPSVLSRLEKTGVVSKNISAEIGMVGFPARASGLDLDIRASHPWGFYKNIMMKREVLKGGDVYARAYIRYLEIKNSIVLIKDLLNKLREIKKETVSQACNNSLEKQSLTVSMVEGWRGEIVHAVITDEQGNICRYKIKDPSFNNWHGLAIAQRNNGISDFPLCNKSFNLSYCGHDL